MLRLIEGRPDAALGLRVVDVVEQCQSALAVAIAGSDKGTPLDLEQTVGVLLGLCDQGQLLGKRAQRVQLFQGFFAGTQNVQFALEDLPVALVTGGRIGACRVSQHVAAVAEQPSGRQRLVELGDYLVPLLQQV
ncbi:hypothetical protein D3C75_688450 [compost metagenome]